ncbi:MAG: hypothetical protein AB7I36_11495 [Rhodospirillaceae bacterium]
MIALFFEDTKAFIGTFDSRRKAAVVGVALSREQNRAIVGIDNSKLGETVLCCRFVGGQELSIPKDQRHPGADDASSEGPGRS